MRLHHWIAALICAIALPTAATAKERHHHKRHHHRRTHHARVTEVTWDHIDHYAQGTGFGGPLSIARSDGSVVRSYFGEKADLECATSADGPFAPCGKENLVDGTRVVDAAHAANQYGNDVWTEIKLVPGTVGEHPGQTPAPAHEPSHEPTPASGVAWDHIDHYAQSSGYGGFLSIARSDGSVVRSYFGEKAVLECGATADGPFAPCGKENLVDGTRVAFAEHAANQYGNDVWTEIKLVREPASTQTQPPASADTQPPASTPAPEPAPSATGVVDSYDAGSRTLGVRRPNGERPGGVIPAGVDVECLVVHDVSLVRIRTCTDADLAAGARVAYARGARVDGVWTWSELAVLVPDGS